MQGDMKLIWTLLLVLLCGTIGLAESPRPLPPGFDPQRHMLISEVAPGMKGYGLSVFSGTKIERFEVEVISILRNFNPRQDVILIRVSGCNLEHTGAIAGMSGSPVYLQDSSGKARLIGAFAYGWPMMKDALAGVQPIEYMLSIPIREKGQPATVPTRVASLSPDQAATAARWSVLDALQQTRVRLSGGSPGSAKPLAAGGPQMKSLLMPLSVSGLRNDEIQQLASAFEPMGMVPLQAGGGSAGPTTQPATIEPGSVLAVPLLTGDMDMAAVGTCTEVLNDKVYGFGHPFTSEGPANMPLCAGRINGIIANLVTSFKLGSATAPRGTLLADQTSGVAGRLGEAAPTASLTYRIRYADGSRDQTFHFQSVIHPQFTPLLSSTALFSAVSAAQELPRSNTLTYHLTATFTDGHVLHLHDTLANANPGVLMMGLSAPLALAADNPFSSTLLKSLEGEVVVYNASREAEIQSLGVTKQSFRPGETVRLFARVQPFRSVETLQPLEFKLPDDLPDGSYTLVVSDVSRYLNDERSNSPYRFSVANVDELFSTLDEIGQLRSDAFYLRLIRNNQSVAVGRTPLQNLPSSHRQMLLAVNRSDVAAYTPSVTSTLPSQWVLTGSGELSLQVGKNPKQATHGAAPATKPGKASSSVEE